MIPRTTAHATIPHIRMFVAFFYCSFVLSILTGLGVTMVSVPVAAQAGGGPPGARAPLAIVAFGDSLTAGFGLAAGDAFPVKLERALKAKGIAATVANAGVSGDTTGAGLERLDWAIPEGTRLVILEFGGNDALRGIDPAVSRRNLDAMIVKIKAKGAQILLAGMIAPRNWGDDYKQRFDSMFPDLAKAHGLKLYPFFLDGIAMQQALNQSDGLHPNARGVDVIVERILPLVADLADGMGTANPGGGAP